jgi:hypothetical protein
VRANGCFVAIKAFFGQITVKHNGKVLLHRYLRSDCAGRFGGGRAGGSFCVGFAVAG